MKNKDKENYLKSKTIGSQVSKEENIQNELNFLIEKFKSEHMTRRKKSDKKLFLDFVKEYFSKYDYKMITDSEEKNINIYYDNIENAKYIFTAHYDTPANSIIMNIAKKLDPIFGSFSLIAITLLIILLMFISKSLNYVFVIKMVLLIIVFIVLYLLCPFKRENKNNMNDNTSGLISLFLLASTSPNKNIAFIFFDNEEKGLKGSKQFARDSINLIDKNATIINLDCVGSGAEWCIYSNEEKIQKKFIESLNGVKIKNGKLTKSDHNSFIKKEDNQNYRNTLYISKKDKSKFGGYYHKNIHTNLDTKICNDDIINLINAIEEVIK